VPPSSELIESGPARTMRDMFIGGGRPIGKRFACSNSISQNLWLLFNGIFGGGSVETPMCEFNWLSPVESLF
jgi:hypothetical protein